MECKQYEQVCVAEASANHHAPAVSSAPLCHSSCAAFTAERGLPAHQAVCLMGCCCSGFWCSFNCWALPDLPFSPFVTAGEGFLVYAAGRGGGCTDGGGSPGGGAVGKQWVLLSCHC